jgi:hypothetical protein
MKISPIGLVLLMLTVALIVFVICASLGYVTA